MHYNKPVAWCVPVCSWLWGHWSPLPGTAHITSFWVITSSGANNLVRIQTWCLENWLSPARLTRKVTSLSFPNTEVPQISKVDCLMHLNPFLNVFYVISWLSDLWTSSCLQVWYTPSASLWTSPVALLMTSLSVRAPPLCCCCWWWQWCTSAAPLWKHLS